MYLGHQKVCFFLAKPQTFLAPPLYVGTGTFWFSGRVLAGRASWWRPERPAGSAAVETWLRQRQLVTAVVSERGAAVTILNHVSRRLFRDGQARVQHGARLLADVASL